MPVNNLDIQTISSTSKLRDLGFIIFRNFFLLTNAIIVGVVCLLFYFGATQTAIFLGALSVINISLGLFQDIHAWRALDKLQSLTAPHALRRLGNGSTEIILTEFIKKNDLLLLKNGDQVPCDGVLAESIALEINEALITGETTTITKKIGDELLAGSVVTSGSGTLLVHSLPHDSRLARMTTGIKKYAINSSPIQHAVEKIIKIAGLVLLGVIVVVIIRAQLAKQTSVELVLNIAALTSVIVPQGLVFAVALFFAYGAGHLFKKHVLLQEVNATEKLGRIKNLCMDKTGTLTENSLTVEKMHLPPKSTASRAAELTNAYIYGTNDSSQTIVAIKKFLESVNGTTVTSALAFSSWRQYGAVLIKNKLHKTCVLAGSPTAFLPHISNKSQKAWLEELISTHSSLGKSIVAIAESSSTTIPETLTNTKLSLVAVFVFHNNLREGIQETINFFQDRGVIIRIISGDNPVTVGAVMEAAGIKNPTAHITGAELASWTKEEYEKRVADYTLFAQIVPEQKEKIIEAFKKTGFTAMVGDGANDALAIKKADLGIAMFDGAPATRQLAAVVLTNNSFSALPGGVELADSIIRNIEIFASLFLNQSFLGFFFFCFLSIAGFAYPLTPFNITLINYCTVAVPGILISYWTLRPSKKAERISNKPFLKRIVPFAISTAAVQAVGASIIFILSRYYEQPLQAGTLALLTFCALGYTFFCFTPRVHNGTTSSAQIKQLVLFALVDVVLVYGIFHISFLFSFFNLTHLSFSPQLGTATAAVLLVSAFAEYLLARHFTPKTKSVSSEN